MKDSPTTVFEDEGDRIVQVVHLRASGRKNVDGGLAGQAGIQLVGGLERGQTFCNGVMGVGNVDGKCAVRVVAAQLRVPNTAGDPDKLVPLLKCTAAEMDDGQTLTGLYKPLEALAGLRSWVGNFPIHKV